MQQLKAIQHGSLFSGIGGFDLAAAWCGWNNAFHCEISEFCNKVLGYYWPEAVSVKNIIGYDWSRWKGKIDVLSGGWPCQKYSVAGKRTGNEPLKDELLKAIRLIKPAWCVLENVYGFITKKFAGEHSFLCEQLETMGYDVQTFDIDAASCGIPTVERHTWIVAASGCERQKRDFKKEVSDIAGTAESFQRGHQGAFDRWSLPGDRVCELGEGLPDGLDIAAISGRKWHRESLLAFGNAIVPQVAYKLFRSIDQVITKFTGDED
jgi:DNA (cytosine-5)-methyltransferase 1